MKHRRWRLNWNVINEGTGVICRSFRRKCQADAYRLRTRTDLVLRLKVRSWQKKPHVVSAKEWPVLNHERGLLIDKKILFGLSLTEHHRLHYLTSVADRYLEQWDLPRIKKLKELEHAVGRTA